MLKNIVKNLPETGLRVGATAVMGAGLFFVWSQAGKRGLLGEHTPYPHPTSTATVVDAISTGLAAIPGSTKVGIAIAAVAASVVEGIAHRNNRPS